MKVGKRKCLCKINKATVELSLFYFLCAFLVFVAAMEVFTKHQMTKVYLQSEFDQSIELYAQ